MSIPIETIAATQDAGDIGADGVALHRRIRARVDDSVACVAGDDVLPNQNRADGLGIHFLCYAAAEGAVEAAEAIAKRGRRIGAQPDHVAANRDWTQIRTATGVENNSVS